MRKKTETEKKRTVYVKISDIKRLRLYATIHDCSTSNAISKLLDMINFEEELKNAKKRSE